MVNHAHIGSVSGYVIGGAASTSEMLYGTEADRTVCGQEVEMTRNEMDRLIDEHFAYEAACDVEGMMSTFTDDAELDIAGFPAPMRGQDEIRPYCVELFGVIQTENVRRLQRHYGEDFMVDDVMWTGHFADGELFGAKGRAGRVRFRMLHVFEFGAGRIRKATIWIDTLTLREQLLSGGIQ